MPATASVPPAVQRGQGGRHEGADRREQDGRVQGLGRRGVGVPGAGGAELEGQLLGLRGAGHDVDAGAAGQRHLGREVGRAAEAVDAEPAPVGQVGPQQGAVADDAGAEQRCHLHVVERLGQRVGVVLVHHGVRRVAAVDVPAGEARRRGTGSRGRTGRSGRSRRCGPARARRCGHPPASACSRRPAGRPRPTISCPGVTRGRRGARSPSVRWRSVRHTPQARTRTRTSPGPGSGTGLSTRTSGWAAPSTGPGPVHHPCLHDVRRWWPAYGRLSVR